MTGGILATISVFLPSFLLVIGIARLSQPLSASPVLKRALGGMLCSFVGPLSTAAVRSAVKAHWNRVHNFLGSAAFVALRLKVDVLWVVRAGILIAAAFAWSRL